MKTKYTTKAGFPTSITIAIGDTLLHASSTPASNHAFIHTITITDTWDTRTQTAEFTTENDMLTCVRAFLEPDCGQAFRDTFPTFGP